MAGIATIWTLAAKTCGQSKRGLLTSGGLESQNLNSHLLRDTHKGVRFRKILWKNHFGKEISWIKIRINH